MIITACYNKEEVTVFVKTPLGIVELDYTEYHKLYKTDVIKTDHGELSMPVIPYDYIKKIIAMRNAADLYINAKRMNTDPASKRLYLTLKAFLRTIHIYVWETQEAGNITKLELLDADQDNETLLNAIITIPI